MPEFFPAPDDITACTPDVLLRLGQGLVDSGTLLAIFAPDDSLQFASPDFMALYDIQPGRQTFDSILRHCYVHKTGPLIESNDIDAWLDRAKAKRRSQPVRKFEVDMIDGRWMFMCETLFADNWLFLAITDITAFKRKVFHLRDARDAAIQAAETDPLTALANRAAMTRRFNDLVEYSKAFNDVFSLVLIDLDRFKMINDSFGHDAGDRVLVHFAEQMRVVLRDRDVVGRIGGEEFMLFMHGASGEQAYAVVERLQAQLRDQKLRLRELVLRYTFSAGIAQWAPGKTLDTLYHEADQALYAAKHAGRDQIRQAG